MCSPAPFMLSVVIRIQMYGFDNMATTLAWVRSQTQARGLASDFITDSFGKRSKSMVANRSVSQKF